MLDRTLHALLAAMTLGTSDPVPVESARGPFRLVLDETMTLPEIGAGQGLATMGDRRFAYGDSETGVLVEFANAGPDSGDPVILRRVALTTQGRDLVPHPTGLAIGPQEPVFLGDTVDGSGRIFTIDLERALRDGTLDRAVRNMCHDDLAVNGTRPEYVRIGGRWLIATADYGGVDNRVRLYDPDALSRCERTSEDGVLVASYPCGPWVQSLEWIDDLGILVLVQNQQAGRFYRLSFCRLDAIDLQTVGSIDLDTPDDELEGFALLGAGRAALLSSSKEANFHSCRLDIGPQKTEPASGM